VTLEEFTESTKQPEPPPALTAVLLALWHDKRGDWEAAHQTAQEIESPDGAWIHAYLHRKEGDLANADTGIGGRRSLSAGRASTRNGQTLSRQCLPTTMHRISTRCMAHSVSS
jgi:hypothetical protein